VTDVESARLRPWPAGELVFAPQNGDVVADRVSDQDRTVEKGFDFRCARRDVIFPASRLVAPHSTEASSAETPAMKNPSSVYE
jgi:hypothetical protein